MTEVEIVSVEHRRLVLSRPLSGTEDGMWAFNARASGDTFQVSVDAWDRGEGLASYFTDLASRWKGFNEELSYSTLEGNLSFKARHDGRGLVKLKVTLGQSWTPRWFVRCDLTMGAGAHLEQAAGEITEFVHAALNSSKPDVAEPDQARNPTVLAMESDPIVRQWRRDSETLARIGAHLFTQDTWVDVRLPRALADEALASWQRADEPTPRNTSTVADPIARSRSGSLSLIGCAVERAHSVGEEVPVRLDAWFIADALKAADEAGLLH